MADLECPDLRRKSANDSKSSVEVARVDGTNDLA
jgi:hypothetical protein